MPADVTSDVDDLYALDLGEFVAARNDLVRRLRKDGDAERAAEIASLRKPSVPVWVANQLARRRRRDVDLLLDASHRLRAATAEADSVRARRGLEQARKAELQAVRNLRRAAAEMLEDRGRGSAAMVDRVVATLRNASRSDEGRELLANGRLAEEVGAAGFDLVEELAPKPGGRRAERRRPGPGAGELEVAREALQSARERKRHADREVREATRRRAEADRALHEADDDLRKAQALAEEADAQAEDAQSTLDRLRKRR